MASPATSSTIIMSSTWASVVPAGKVPKDYPPPLRRPLCPSWRAGFAPIPTKSGASRASGWICGSRERRRPGPAHRGQRRTRPPAAGTRSRPDTAEDCGSDCGSGVARAGRERLQGSSPPRSTFSDLTWAVGGTKAHLRTHLLSIANTRMPYPSLHELWCTTISQLEDAPDDWGRHLIDFQLWSASRLRPGS